MASGVPVITSNTSSMPEVAGGCAHLIDPTSTEELTKAIIHILSDQEYRERLICRGLKQSQAFSWAQSAKNVLEIYEQFDN
jgi:glycosyltransferase involved in cell wall biosynthesis